jgi:hypothetical protein
VLASLPQGVFRISTATCFILQLNGKVFARTIKTKEIRVQPERVDCRETATTVAFYLIKNEHRWIVCTLQRASVALIDALDSHI